MKHPERVQDYLEHIAEAIDRATGYLQPIPDHKAFQRNPQVQDAVIRNIEVIRRGREQDQQRRPGLHQTTSRNSMGADARHAQHGDP